MITIVFETHSTSVDNQARLASGHHGAALSALGEQQAKELGQRYRDEVIDAVFCSDLQRSYRTAEIAFERRTVPIIRDVRLRECDYGDWTRKSSEEVQAEGPRRVTTPFPNGESYEQAAARMKNFLEDLSRDYGGKKVLIVGHRATHYGLEHWISGRSLEEIVMERWSWQPGWTYVVEGL